MNKIKVSVSRGTTPQRQRLPLLRLNRRFLICCALCAATLQLALAEIPPDRTRNAWTPAAPHPANLAQSPFQQVISEEPRLSEWDASQIIKPPHRNDASHRRDKFETEFGIDGKTRTGVLGSVQLAKYTLDDVTFTVDDFTRNLSDALKLEYDHGRVHRAASPNDNASPRLSGPGSGIPRGLRFGPELNLTGGKPYVGLVVVVPFGD